MKNEFLQKDLVLVSFPFSNQLDSKIRPVLIVSNNSYNSSCGDCLIAGITSSLNSNIYTVNIDDADLVSGKLIVASRIKADHLLLIEKAMIIKKIASISDSFFEKVKDKINSLF